MCVGHVKRFAALYLQSVNQSISRGGDGMSHIIAGEHVMSALILVVETTATAQACT